MKGDGSFKSYQVENGHIYGDMTEAEVDMPDPTKLSKMSREALGVLRDQMGIMVANFDNANRSIIAGCIRAQFNERKEVISRGAVKI